MSQHIIKYTYYWNESRYSFDGFKEGAALSIAYEGTLAVEADEDELRICERLFRIFNTDERPKDYRGPSMSVGSVVKVGDIAMACFDIGFVNVDISKSPIVQAWWKKG